MSTIEDFKKNLRVMGIGGLFSYYGSFKSKRLGKYLMYSTNMAKNIIIKTDKDTIVISPEEPDEALKAIKEFLLSKD